MKLRKFFGGALLSAVLMTPVAMNAQDHRYYDNAHKDYHQWNNDEDAAYHRWLKEMHKKDHDWAHANKQEQQSYWNWRHEHPDHH